MYENLLVRKDYQFDILKCFKSEDPISVWVRTAAFSILERGPSFNHISLVSSPISTTSSREQSYEISPIATEE